MAGLNGPGDRLWKSGDKSFALFVDEYLCLVFGHHAHEIDIDHLPVFDIHLRVVSLG